MGGGGIFVNLWNNVLAISVLMYAVLYYGCWLAYRNAKRIHSPFEVYIVLGFLCISIVYPCWQLLGQSWAGKWRLEQNSELCIIFEYNFYYTGLSYLIHKSVIFGIKCVNSSILFLESCEISEVIANYSRPEVFCKKDVLNNFAKFTGKHLCLCLFFDKVAGLTCVGVSL